MLTLRLALVCLALSGLGCSSSVVGTRASEGATPADAAADTNSTDRTDASAIETGSDADAVDAADAPSLDVGSEDVSSDAASDALVDDAPVSDASDSGPPDTELPFGQPVVELVVPASLALTTGVHEVRYSIRSTGLPIAVKKTEIFFHESRADGATPWRPRWNASLVGTRFLRDGVEVDPTTYRLISWVFPMVAGISSITVEWQTEEVVSMAGHSYAIIMPITAVFGTGDSVNVGLSSGSATAPIERGRLTPNGSDFGIYHVPGPQVWIGSGRCVADEIIRDGSVRYSPFVWSDLSSHRHATDDCASTNSSDDWLTRAVTITGGTYTLTAP